jgi:hypothetical protein
VHPVPINLWIESCSMQQSHILYKHTFGQLLPNFFALCKVYWRSKKQQSQEIFSFPKHSDWLWGLPIHWVLGFKCPGHDVDHSLPSSTKIKKKWSYTISSVCIHGVDRATLSLLYCLCNTHCCFVSLKMK